MIVVKVDGDESIGLGMGGQVCCVGSKSFSLFSGLIRRSCLTMEHSFSVYIVGINIMSHRRTFFPAFSLVLLS